MVLAIYTDKAVHAIIFFKSINYINIIALIRIVGTGKRIQ